MGVYNLYLLDETRDPKVIARLARATGLAENVVRREARRPPFLVLKEHGLAQAVTVRREFEMLGLTFRLELVDAPSGSQTHPLAGEQAPDDGAEIVLEEGLGFRQAETETVSAPPAKVPRRRGRGVRWAWPALALLLLAAGWLGLRAWRGDAETRQVVAHVEMMLPALQERMDRMLAGTRVDPVAVDSLRGAVVELERQARPVWDQLPAGVRGRLDALLAGRGTLDLRRERELRAQPAGPRDLRRGLADPVTAPADEAFWSELAAEWPRRVAPASLDEQLALERLHEQVSSLVKGPDRQARLRLDRMQAADPGGGERLAARVLAGSLRQKGVAWTGNGGVRQGWADLPDSTVLDVAERSGRVHVARVLAGRLVFDANPGELTEIGVRLAAIELQPKGLQRVLDAGLRLFAPEVYFATLPGSSLPRLRPAAAAEQWRSFGDPALKAELARLGLTGDDLRRPVLEQDRPLTGGQEDLVDWLRAAASRYEKAGAWPERLELRTPAGRFRVSGCELWHLSRGSTS